MPEENTDIAQEIVIYAGPGVELSLPLDREHETVWATQAQIAELFGIDRSRVTRHVNNVFRDEEVGLESNVRKAHIAFSDRPVSYYSLDVILAVGYRANSARAIQFRRWASGVLSHYILEGVAINEKRVDELGSIVRLLSRADNELVSGVADVLAGYVPGLQLLREYDEGHVVVPDGVLPGWELTIEEARAIIKRVGNEFPHDKLFGHDPQGKRWHHRCHLPGFRWPGHLPDRRRQGGQPALPRRQRPRLGGWEQAQLLSLSPSSIEMASYPTRESPEFPITP